MTRLYVTLNQFLRGEVNLDERHLNAMKEMLLRGMRSKQRKQAISSLTLNRLKGFKQFGMFDRVVFYQDGSCRYITGQEPVIEMRQLRELVLKEIFSSYKLLN